MSATPAVMDQPIEHYVGWANRLGGTMNDGENADSLSTISRRCQSITRASPSSRLFHQNTTFHHIVNISQGRILRAFGELGPFGRCQLAFKIVE
jgi:hypothetical protein